MTTPLWPWTPLETLTGLFATPMVLYVAWLFYGLPAWVLLIKPTCRVVLWAYKLTLRALHRRSGQSHSQVLAGGLPESIHEAWSPGYDLYCPSTNTWIIGNKKPSDLRGQHPLCS